MQFSRDGQTLASASDDNTVRLWSLTGDQLQILRHSRVVRSVGFSPDGQTVVSGGDDNAITLWNRNGQLLYRLEGHRAKVTGVLFTDARTLMSVSEDQSVRVQGLEASTLDAFEHISSLDLEDLISAGCEWVGDYLQTNSSGKDDRTGGPYRWIRETFQSLFFSKSRE